MVPFILTIITLKLLIQKYIDLKVNIIVTKSMSDTHTTLVVP